MVISFGEQAERLKVILCCAGHEIAWHGAMFSCARPKGSILACFGSMMALASVDVFGIN